MAKNPPELPAETPGPVDPFGHAGDAHWGQGGRYLIDPATGQRQPAPALDPDGAGAAPQGGSAPSNTPAQE